MKFEITMSKQGPYLKKNDRPRRVSEDGRGLWMEIGRQNHTGIERIVRENQKNGYLVLPDDEGNYRVFVLFE